MAINFNERIEDERRAIEQAINGKLASVWTSLPGTVVKFDPAALTCDVQPTIQGRRINETGGVDMLTMPVLLDCPVVFPHAGGASLTFPIKEGDEVLVVFASRGIDFWWQNGGVQPPPEMRMHDLSDGFAIPGVWSQPNRIPNVSTDSVQLRTDDKRAFIEIKTASKDINAITPSDMTVTVGGSVTVNVAGDALLSVAGATTIDCKSTTITGKLTVNGGASIKGGASVEGKVSVDGDVAATGDVTGGEVTLLTHVHGGISRGSHNTEVAKNASS